MSDRSIGGWTIRNLRFLGHEKCDIDLIRAAYNGNLKAVSALVKSGTDANFKGCMALRMAARNGHKNVVQFLLDHGSEVNTLTGYGGLGHPLAEAIRGGHVEIVELLLKAGANIVSPMDSTNEQVIYVAVHLQDNHEIFDLILQHIFCAKIWQNKSVADVEAQCEILNNSVCSGAFFRSFREDRKARALEKIAEYRDIALYCVYHEARRRERLKNPLVVTSHAMPRPL